MYNKEKHRRPKVPSTLRIGTHTEGKEEEEENKKIKIKDEERKKEKQQILAELLAKDFTRDERAFRHHAPRLTCVCFTALVRESRTHGRFCRRSSDQKNNVSSGHTRILCSCVTVTYYITISALGHYIYVCFIYTLLKLSVFYWVPCLVDASLRNGLLKLLPWYLYRIKTVSLSFSQSPAVPAGNVARHYAT